MNPGSFWILIGHCVIVLAHYCKLGYRLTAITSATTGVMNQNPPCRSGAIM